MLSVMERARGIVCSVADLLVRVCVVYHLSEVCVATILIVRRDLCALMIHVLLRQQQLRQSPCQQPRLVAACVIQ